MQQQAPTKERPHPWQKPLSYVAQQFFDTRNPYTRDIAESMSNLADLKMPDAFLRRGEKKSFHNYSSCSSLRDSSLTCLPMMVHRYPMIVRNTPS